ncbi:MAG: alpha/beta hydrolase [Streptosporangiaceae bacterium]|jgi:pimeloyl-ACP methyl ester carboxylesterase
MPFVATNGIRLAYERAGSGEPVLMIMGQAAGGNVWTMYQAPALTRAGYEAITFDNRGIPPSDVPPGDYSLADLVADTAGLIEALDIGPCRLVATSLGAFVATELATSRPDLVTCCVLMAFRSRADAFRLALQAGERALSRESLQMPPAYDAPMSVLQMFSPTTLNDDVTVPMWLDIYEMAAARRSAARGQDAIDVAADRRDALRAVPVPCRIIAFSDDLVCPPHLCAEAAEAIPDCDYVEIGPCGHVGYLERPDDVNSAMIEFLDKH